MHSLLLINEGIPEVSFRLTGSHTIGRSSACDIQVLSPDLSRQHARISLKEDQVWLSDLGSQNGSFVGGEPVGEPRRLHAGDEVRLGQVAFIFDPPVEARYSANSDSTLYVVSDDVAGPCHVERLEGTLPPPEVSSLMQIFKLTCEVAERLEMDRLLPELLRMMIAHFEAERGYILLGKSVKTLKPAAVYGHQKDIAVSRGLIERTFDSETPLLIRDALESLSFVGSRSVVAHNLRAVMVMPLLVDQKPIGVIQIDKQQAGAFDKSDLARFALLGKSAAFTVENAMRFEKVKLKSDVAAGDSDGMRFIGDSPQIRTMLAIAKRAAASPARVLITGESGVGKELVARLIHRQSDRAENPMVAVNCGALPENSVESALFGHRKGAFTGAVARKKGLFEVADGGTLFLDEVGELSLDMQVKLLRAVQEGSFYPMGFERPVSVDVRIIAATNRDLEKAVQAGHFREDLYYRLNVIAISVPPLRERTGDIPILFRHFFTQFSRSVGKPVPEVTGEAMAKIVAYPYPGNVRELQNIVERLSVLGEGGMIRLADLPREMLIKERISIKRPSGLDLKTVLAEVERDMIRAALLETGGVKVAACRVLGISRPTLDKKIVELSIEM
jgi:transcriptional regulator with GAF, ATPase, and Fis domain